MQQAEIKLTLLYVSSLVSDDHSRVILSQLDGHLCSDYINASYIDVGIFTP